MPLFFFHLRSGAHLNEDTIGVELAKLDAARREALLAAADILRGAALTGIAATGEAFEIVDQDGRPVLTLPFDAQPDEGRAG